MTDAPSAPPSPQARRLVGRTAVITGGCSGIGLATARRFAAEGERALIMDWEYLLVTAVVA